MSTVPLKSVNNYARVNIRDTFNLGGQETSHLDNFFAKHKEGKFR